MSQIPHLQIMAMEMMRTTFNNPGYNMYRQFHYADFQLMSHIFCMMHIAQQRLLSFTKNNTTRHAPSPYLYQMKYPNRRICTLSMLKHRNVPAPLICASYAPCVQALEQFLGGEINQSPPYVVYFSAPFILPGLIRSLLLLAIVSLNYAALLLTAANSLHQWLNPQKSYNPHPNHSPFNTSSRQVYPTSFGVHADFKEYW